MRYLERDPRTIARDIPAIGSILFPKLVPGFVAHLNSKAKFISGAVEVSESLIANSSISNAMLFEFASVLANQKALGQTPNVDECIQIARKKQLRYYDVGQTDNLSETDILIANQTSDNLIKFFEKINLNYKELIEVEPLIPGLNTISSGKGDFSINENFIEVKCLKKNFSAPDYRQILFYWLLRYADSIESGHGEWTTGYIVNPRRNLYVNFEFEEILNFVSDRSNKLKILQKLKNHFLDQSDIN